MFDPSLSKAYLEEIAEIIDCPHSTPEWKESGIPAIRNYNLINGHIDFSNPSFVSDEEYKQRIKRGIPEYEDLVLSREAPIGNIGMIPDNCKCCLGQRVVLIKVNKEKCNPYYLLYALQSTSVQNQMIYFAGSGTTVSNLRIPFIKKLTIYLPSLSLQNSIVKMLTPFDKKISCNNQINDYLLDLIFTEFNHVSKKLLTHYVPLMDLCTFISRGVSPKYVDDSDYWVLGQTCIRNHVVTLDNARTLVSKDYGEKAVHKGDILVNSTGIGSLGRVAQLWFDHPKLVVDSHISIVRPQPVYQEYLGCYLMSIENEIENMAEGSTGQTELPRKSLMQITVPLPEDSIVESFNKRVRPLFNMINNNLESNRTLSSIRETLLPKLLSGQVN